MAMDYGKNFDIKIYFLLFYCSGVSTLVFLLPSNLMLALRPSPKSFLLALVSTQAAFS
jgi:hypothetical protein